MCPSNQRLATLCARMWGLGFLGMGIAKGVFDHGPGALAFDLSARLWAVGGLTYALLAALYLCASDADERS